MIIDTAENHGQSPDSMPAARRPSLVGSVAPVGRRALTCQSDNLSSCRQLAHVDLTPSGVRLSLTATAEVFLSLTTEKDDSGIAYSALS